ncbi:hypothetical protein Aph01nite_05760 [Acrocarpospora phusangensis]|uniref:Uncharacterized protein n=1 Tax=Acrocarpospora phusangensis TaxID=1070424 RepID=A0A919Q623_9ACTN|nr:bpX6 domain-containing protein [Acrocarpospora phusangensis]GIH22266.1 hypothetical protein Aph01nite_05760 [Acrocarpospora phusangensis]
MTTYRGRATATAFILDVPLIGEHEARRRVIAFWRHGAELRVLPHGHWLLHLAEPTSVRAELAPGLLAEPGADEIAWKHAGSTRVERLSALPTLNPADWLNSTTLRIAHLKPLEPPEPPVPSIERMHKPAPDLRAAAKIGRSSPLTDRATSELRARLPHARSSGGSHAARLWSHVRSALVWLAVKSPAFSLVRRRHQRYLRDLTRAFEQRRWDDALREAIALGGSETALRTLRLPRRRGSLRPSLTTASSSASLSYGPTVYEHLQDLYRSAAEALERAGEVIEAAFVLADLLDSPAEAVDLLERHRHWRLAAELAEGRDLSADLVVRLWWRAGDRGRAVDLARSRGAFATGILRLATVDAAAALELRHAWVHDRQAAVDHIGAVEAAWPEAKLRPMVVSSIQTGIALGGADAGHLFAYLAAYQPGEAARSAVQALVDSDDPATLLARARFGTTFAELRCDDPVADRALATAGLRALVRDGGWTLDRKTLGRVTKALSSRADPLAVADLADVPRAPRSAAEAPFVTASGPPGTIALFDAAVLGNGGVLAACGDAGTFLLTRDGRVRARWDIPAHQLVIADHGGAALLVNRRESVRDVHRLDLATRKVRRWTALRVKAILPSYDGGLLTAVSDEGIVVFDVLADSPRMVWREMTEAAKILSVNRTATSISAIGLVSVNGRPQLEAWRWELPGWTLRGRTRVRSDESLHVLACGKALSPTLSAGDVHATVDDGVAEVRAAQGEVMFRAAFPDGDTLGLRSHAGITTLFDSGGRIVAVDEHGTVQANLRLRIA